MSPSPLIIDTNVLVSGMLTRNPDASTCRIVDGMIAGAFPFLLSAELMAEYRAVLLRPAIASLHRLSEAELESILKAIASRADFLEPTGAPARAPDPGDQHLWDLLHAAPESILVTGDKALLARASSRTRILNPMEALERMPH